MPFYERGDTRIYYEEVGSGFPLLVIPGGGLNSTVASLGTSVPFNPMEVYKDDFRVIAADLRNAPPGQSSGPVEIDRPWDAYSEDQLGLMDHLGMRGVPGHGVLHRRADDPQPAAAGVGAHCGGGDDAAERVQAGDTGPVLPEQHHGVGAANLREKRPEITEEMVHDFLTNMYTNRADFVFTVSRDFVRSPADAAADRAGRRDGAPVRGCDGGRRPCAERRGDDLSVEGLAGAHRRGGGARSAVLEGARAGGGCGVGGRGGKSVRETLRQAQGERVTRACAVVSNRVSGHTP